MNQHEIAKAIFARISLHNGKEGKTYLRIVIRNIDWKKEAINANVDQYLKKCIFYQK